MPSRTRPRLHPSADWPDIIDQLLDSPKPRDRDNARVTMWVEVVHYVVRRARLPLGPLSDDEEIRHDVAVRVLERLERDGNRRIREWRDRQRARRDHASWWGWILRMAWSISIDLARGSRQNIASRGNPFLWAKVIPMEPSVISGVQGGSIQTFVDSCSADDLRVFFTELQDIFRVDGGTTAFPSESVESEKTPTDNGTDGRHSPSTKRR